MRSHILVSTSKLNGLFIHTWSTWIWTQSNKVSHTGCTAEIRVSHCCSQQAVWWRHHIVSPIYMKSWHWFCIDVYWLWCKNGSWLAYACSSHDCQQLACVIIPIARHWDCLNVCVAYQCMPSQSGQYWIRMAGSCLYLKAFECAIQSMAVVLWQKPCRCIYNHTCRRRQQLCIFQLRAQHSSCFMHLSSVMLWHCICLVLMLQFCYCTPYTILTLVICKYFHSHTDSQCCNHIQFPACLVNNSSSTDAG